MKLFQGTYTAIITPFTQDNKVDYPCFEKLIEEQIAGGVEGIVFVGTTGESPTILDEEHYEIFRWAVKTIRGRCQVIHGTGSNSTLEAIKQSEVAKESGADGQLLVNPYYNKPSQEGLFQHFTAVANATDLPMILYNIKGRSGVNLETSTLLRLAEHKNIVGVKEASGDIFQVMDVIQKVPKDFSVLSGEESLTFPLIALGGDGIVSVASNYIPRTLSDFVRLCLKGRFEEARPIFYALLDLMQVSFIETNPTPAKAILSMLGKCRPDLRLPLVPPSESSLQKIRKVLEELRKSPFLKDSLKVKS